jgi:hypothetical protein
MTKDKAIELGNALVLRNTGIRCDPDSARLVSGVGERPHWALMYNAKWFFPEEIAAGAVIDGGEYFITVDDATGEVSVFG